jgi:hypothetical protein
MPGVVDAVRNEVKSKVGVGVKGSEEAKAKMEELKKQEE